MKWLLLVLLTIVTIPTEAWRSLESDDKWKVLAFYCQKEAVEKKCREVLFSVKVGEENTTINVNCVEEA